MQTLQEFVLAFCIPYVFGILSGIGLCTVWNALFDIIDKRILKDR
ncbi:hypothetical protein [Chromobacterium amazonense]|nr:hypothetical protein [Chromobacterium amazonense]